MNTDHYATAVTVFQDEITALQTTLEHNQVHFNAAVELLLGCTGKVVVTGLGKSGLIGHKMAATFASTGTPAVFLNAAEALHGDLGIIANGDCVIMISNSGATIELLNMWPSLETIGVKTIGLFGNTGTLLAKRVDVCLDITIEKEACPLNLAPMSSTTAVLVMGDALAAAMMKAKQFQPQQFAVLHPGGILGRKLLLKAKDVMHRDDIPSVHAQASFKEAVIEIARLNLGAVCVHSENGQLVGIITDGDIRRQLMKNPDLTIKAEQMMTADPQTVSPEDSLDAVLRKMEHFKIYVLPAVNADQRACGMIRMHDILDSA